MSAYGNPGQGNSYKEQIYADPEYDAVVKIIRAYYRMEKDAFLSDPQLIADLAGDDGSAEEAAALFVLEAFPSGFVTPQCIQEVSNGELSGLIDAVYRNLTGTGPAHGDAAKVLVDLCDSLSCEAGEAKWYYDKELKYLETARSAGAIKDRHYQKLKKDLLEHPPV